MYIVTTNSLHENDILENKSAKLTTLINGLNDKFIYGQKYKI